MMAPSLSCRHGFSEGGSGWGRAQEMRAGVLGVSGVGAPSAPTLWWISAGPEILCSGPDFGLLWATLCSGAVLGNLAPGRNQGVSALGIGWYPRQSAGLSETQLASWKEQALRRTGTPAGSRLALLCLFSSPQPVSGGICSSALCGPSGHLAVMWYSLVAISPPAERLVHDRPDLHVIDLLTERGILSWAEACRGSPLQCLPPSALGLQVWFRPPA